MNFDRKADMLNLLLCNCMYLVIRVHSYMLSSLLCPLSLTNNYKPNTKNNINCGQK